MNSFDSTKFLLDFNKLDDSQQNLVIDIVHNFVQLNLHLKSFNNRLNMEAFLNE